jgi:hypothetical protein
VDQIVFHARTAELNEPSVRASIAPMLTRVAHLPHVTGVTSPYAPRGSRDLAERDDRVRHGRV